MASCAYIRVSTEHQDLERQKDIISEYIQKNNIVIDSTFEDKLTGSLYDRPGFTELQTWVSANPGGFVYMAALDRAARSLIVYVELRKLCESNNVKLVFINSPKTGEVAVDTLLEGILASFAEYEKTIIAQRLMSGKLTKLRNNNPVVSRVPLGYKYIKTDGTKAQIVLNEEEAHIVKRVYSMYVDDLMSIRAIAVKLSQEKVPTRNRVRGWERETIRGILANPSYSTGFLYYGKSKSTNSKTPNKKTVPVTDTSQWISLPVDKIIDEELFKKAQKRLLINKQFNPRHTKYEYLLSSLITCGVCGRLYASYTTNYGGKFARCSSRDYLDKEGNRTWCKNRAIKIQPLESFAWNLTKLLIHSPEALVSQYEKLKKPTEIKLNEIEKELQSITKKLTTIEHKYDEIFKEFNSGSISMDTFKRYESATDEQKKVYIKRKKEITKDIESMKYTLSTLDSDKEKFSMRKILSAENLDEIPFGDKQEAVRQYIKQILVLPVNHKYQFIFHVPITLLPDGDNVIPFDNAFEKVDIKIQAEKLSYGKRTLKNGDHITITHLSFSMNIDLRTPLLFTIANPYSKYDMTTVS